MSDWIPFRVLFSGGEFIQNDPPASFESVRSECNELLYLKTKDAEWVKRAEKEGKIQRLDTQPNQGIQQVTILEGALESDPVQYRLELDVGDCGTITLSESEIFNYSKFRQKYLAIFQKLLPHMKNSEWEAVISPLIEEADRVQDDINESPVIMEVVNKIECAEVIHDKKELATGAGNRVWLDTSTDTLFVLSKELEPIAEKYHIELRRLAALLADYRKGSARRERIGRRLFQLWQFKPSRFQLRGLENNETE